MRYSLLVNKVQIVKFYNEANEASNIIVQDGLISNTDGEELSYLKAKLFSQLREIDANGNDVAKVITIKLFVDDLEMYNISDKSDVNKLLVNSLVYVEGVQYNEGDALAWDDKTVASTSFFNVENWSIESDAIIIADMQKRVRALKLMQNKFFVPSGKTDVVVQAAEPNVNQNENQNQNQNQPV
jgi:virulence-associated protein VapD